MFKRSAQILLLPCLFFALVLAGAFLLTAGYQPTDGGRVLTGVADLRDELQCANYQIMSSSKT
jgi:hypothetical protein